MFFFFYFNLNVSLDLEYNKFFFVHFVDLVYFLKGCVLIQLSSGVLEMQIEAFEKLPNTIKVTQNSTSGNSSGIALIIASSLPHGHFGIRSKTAVKRSHYHRARSGQSNKFT